MRITKLEEIDIAINELFAEGVTEEILDKEISVILDLISEYARQEVIKEADRMSFLADMYGLYAHTMGVSGEVGQSFEEWLNEKEK